MGYIFSLLLTLNPIAPHRALSPPLICRSTSRFCLALCLSALSSRYCSPSCYHARQICCLRSPPGSVPSSTPAWFLSGLGPCVSSYFGFPARPFRPWYQEALKSVFKSHANELASLPRQTAKLEAHHASAAWPRFVLSAVSGIPSFAVDIVDDAPDVGRKIAIQHHSRDFPLSQILSIKNTCPFFYKLVSGFE